MSLQTKNQPIASATGETDAEATALRLVVMLGGPSAEREVSLKTGHSVATALRACGHEIFEIDPRTDDWSLPERIDAVFLALHGSYGEDGTIQRRLDELGVAYTGCGAAASDVAFDKARTKEVWADRGIPTPRGHIFSASADTLPQGWSLPVILKPVRQGSSVGLQIVESENVFGAALDQALKFDNAVLMEEMIRGRELTAGILDGEALPLLEVRPRQGTYDYQNKYTEGATEYFCPADLNEELTRWIQDLALQAFAAVGGRDYGRLDLLLRGESELFFLEVNTLPGMTATSLLPKAAKAAGIGYEQLCQMMIDVALRRAKT
jgi:D-alanine-D-alanine ligase